MQKLEEKKDILTADFINSAKGECLFIRGFICSSWARSSRMPLCALQHLSRLSTFPLAKSSQADIWKQAIEDPDNCGHSAATQKCNYRQTRGAAYAALKYIFMRSSDKAIEVLEPLQNHLILINW